MVFFTFVRKYLFRFIWLPNFNIRKHVGIKGFCTQINATILETLYKHTWYVYSVIVVGESYTLNIIIHTLTTFCQETTLSTQKIL